MPVRSQLQERKTQEAARERALAAQLAAHRPAVAEALDPLRLAHELARQHPAYVCREPQSFNRRIRSKDPDKIRLVAAEHVFGRYPAPRHVRAVWKGATRPAGAQAGPQARAEAETVARRRAFRTQLYLTCVSGGSVHKACTAAFMTKKETHRFLGLAHTESFVEAVWFTLARSFTDDAGVAHRMRIAAQSYEDPFWREALRLFCLNPVPLARLNDMIDFLRQAHAADPTYTVRGRTLRSVAEQVEQWHRAVNRARRMGEARWPGVDLEDATFRNCGAGRERRVDWRFTQITSSHALAEEGTTMHHCVYSYQALCIGGGASIWSLKTRPADPTDRAPWRRALTIEMDNAARRLVQLRGYANRPMNNDERQIVSRWASENGLSVAYRN